MVKHRPLPGFMRKMMRISEEDFIVCKPTPSDIALAREHTPPACTGGRSQFRDEEERRDNIEVDQYVGLIGVLMVVKWLFDDVQPFIEAREHANEDPHKGDHGSDFLNLPIDVKSSLIRSDKPLLRHCCWVRPREKHEGNIYIQVLVEDLNTNDWSCNVLITGWCFDSDLPDEPVRGNRGGSVYEKRIGMLRPMEDVVEEVLKMLEES